MIRLRTLGGVDLVDSEGQELRALLAQPKRLALLTYLALATPRGFHRRDTLLALFWPEHDNEHARNSLSQSVHVLRRHLGPEALGTSGDAIGLERGALSCDALAFEEALDRGDHAEALELYRGALLEGFHIPNAPDFERWLRGERERLAERWGKGAAVAAEEREAASDFSGAATCWRRLAAHDPYSSRVALRLMRALASAGDAAAAVTHARIHETLLRDELGVPPDPEVGRLVRQLQSTPAVDEVEPPSRTPVLTLDVTGAKPVPPAVATGRARFAHRRLTKLTAGLLTLVVVAVVAALPLENLSGDSTESILKELYRGGQAAELTRTAVGLEIARESYQRCIELDSAFALCYAGLARVYDHMAFYDFAPLRAAADTSAKLARLAMKLDSTLPETRAAYGLSLANAWAFEAAEREFKRAIDLGPNNAQAHYWYSMLLVALDRGEEARTEADRALALDPNAPRAAAGMKKMAEYLITGERAFLKQPAKEHHPILTREPLEPWALMQQGVGLAEEGSCAEARSDVLRAVQMAPGNNLRIQMHVGAVYWLCGETGRAREVLAEMKRHPGVRDHGSTVAVLHARFGELDSAFVWLPQQRWLLAHLAVLSANRFLDPLRPDPRYTELMRRLGIRPLAAPE